MLAKLVPWYVWLAIAAAVVTAATAYVMARERAAYIRGQDELQTAIVRRDHAAAEKAQEVRNDIDWCYDHSRTWNQTTGKCDPPK